MDNMDDSIKSTVERNPFKNPVILDHLFKLCPVPILATCRRVCKQWYEESLVTWRTESTVIIAIYQDGIFVGPSYPRNSNRAVTTLTEFLEFNDKPENQCSTKPYRNIVLEHQGNKLCLSSEEFMIFWRLVGTNLTTLKLVNCKFNFIEEFRQIIYKRCPVLQELTLRSCFILPHRSGREEADRLECKEALYGKNLQLKSLDITITPVEGARFPWLGMFAHFPLLTSLNVSYVRENELDILMEALRILQRKTTYTTHRGNYGDTGRKDYKIVIEKGRK